MRQEPKADRERHRAVEEGGLSICREIGDRLEIERDRLLQRAEHLLEGATLHGDVETEGDRLPVAGPSFGVAMQGSRFQHQAPRTSPAADHRPHGTAVSRPRNLRWAAPFLQFPLPEARAVKPWLLGSEPHASPSPSGARGGEQRVGDLGAGDVAVARDPAVGREVVELAGGEGVDAVLAEQLARERLRRDPGERAVAADAAEDVVLVAEVARVLARQARRDRIGDADRVSLCVWVMTIGPGDLALRRRPRGRSRRAPGRSPRRSRCARRPPAAGSGWLVPRSRCRRGPSPPR